MKETSEITPSELLSDFNSRGLKGMILFTIVVHIVLILATSGSYIWRKVAGADSSKLGESERLELAVKEVQSSMRRIAEQHGIKPQDLGSHFTSTATAPKATPQATPNTDTKAETAPPAPEKPKSAMEKELKESKPGPAMPTDEDLFK
ncbi:MAG: hypothetical protein WCS43_05200 [Verrucomicrobiota bacterium]